ncbi:MAG: acyltransferase [Ruminococcaceae bacterium]|nr:acyltransferase [Oscillospiraceae bacterium]
MDNISKERIYKFDNIKLLAIILVVVGHVIDSFTAKSDMFKSLFIFIYAFHMPLFIFISGLFQQRFSDTNKLKINKIAFYIILGFLLKVLNALCKVVRGKRFHIVFFGGGTIEWFLFVLAMFMITAYLLRKVHPAIMLSVSLVIGCICGYFEFICDDYWLSRYFVFLPFYLLGYYMTPELIIKIEKNYAVKIISGLSMLIFFIMSFRTLPFVYQLRRLFTGRNPFSTLKFECGFQHRLLCYAISALLCMAVFCFIPNIKIPILSNMGKNTLAVYFWHRPILYLVGATPFFSSVLALGDPLYKIILLSFGVILALLLSLDIFMLPLKYLNKLIDKLKPLWCYVLIASPFLIGLILDILKIKH